MTMLEASGSLNCQHSQRQVPPCFWESSPIWQALHIPAGVSCPIPQEEVSALQTLSFPGPLPHPQGQ